MNSRFEILFRLRFKHGYFDNLEVNCFSVLPDNATAGYLQNNNLFFKAKANGFDLLFESESNGVTRKKENVLQEKGQLKFFVRLNDTLFYNYTALASFDVSTSIFYFSNVYNSENSAIARLHKGEYASVDDIKKTEDVKVHSMVKPFALIEVNLDPVSANELEIKFQEKATYWKYLIVSEHLKNIDRPAVINGDVNFEGPSKIMLPNNKEAIVFISEKPIGLHKRAVKKIQLLENYDKATQKGKVVLKTLPIPDVNIISSFTKDTNPVELSEIVI